jgi:hypothetical protein
MPTTRLTKSKIEKATVPPEKREYWLWDTDVRGFGVRCSSGGAKTYGLKYRPRPGGRDTPRRWQTIAPVSAIDLDDARRAALVLAGAVARGEDPAQQQREARRRHRATLSKLLAEDGPYELHLEERRLANPKTPLSSLRRGLKAHMATDIAVLSRNDIVTAIDALTKLGKPAAAASLRKFSHSFCEWAVAQGLAKFNPMPDCTCRASPGRRNCCSSRKARR